MQHILDGLIHVLTKCITYQREGYTHTYTLYVCLRKSNCSLGTEYQTRIVVLLPKQTDTLIDRETCKQVDKQTYSTDKQVENIQLDT